MRDLPHRRWTLAVLAIVLLAGGGPAQEPVPPKDRDAVMRQSIAQQERLQRKYRAVERGVSHLAQRLESSSKQEDRDKAKILKDAIKAAADKGIDAKFTTLLTTLHKEGTADHPERLKGVLELNRELREALDRFQTSLGRARLTEADKAAAALREIEEAERKDYVRLEHLFLRWLDPPFKE